MIRTLAAAALIAGAIVAPIAASADPIVPVPVDAVSPAMVEQLTAHGWRGDPTDGAVQVYAPRSAAIDACATDTDCSIASGDPLGTW